MIIIIKMIYLILVQFKISDVIYRLTLVYHGTASPFCTFSYTSFILLSHLFLTMSKYFPKFCVCTSLFLLSSHKHHHKDMTGFQTRSTLKNFFQLKHAN